MVFLSWGRPSTQDQKACINKSGTFNYDDKYKGATAKSLSSLQADKGFSKDGFLLNNARVLVGSGIETFEKGKTALRSWSHFGLNWAFVDPKTPVQQGAKLCVCVREFLPWLMLPLQVVYVNETSTTKNRGASFGFGSGTLHGHLLFRSREKFTVKSKMGMPIFNGSRDTYWWLIQFCQYLEALKVREETWLSRVQLGLDGEAYSWWRSRRENHQKVGFITFEKALLIHFKPEFGIYVQDSGEQEQEPEPVALADIDKEKKSMAAAKEGAKKMETKVEATTENDQEAKKMADQGEKNQPITQLGEGWVSKGVGGHINCSMSLTVLGASSPKTGSISSVGVLNNFNASKGSYPQTRTDNKGYCNDSNMIGSLSSQQWYPGGHYQYGFMTVPVSRW